MWWVSPVLYFRLPSALVPMMAFDSLVMPQPLMQSMLKVGTRLISRPEGRPRTRTSPEWPPDHTP
jgi:hypothetical protein